MISKTKIGKRTRKKTNSEIVETLNAAKKNRAWMKVAQTISSSARNYSSVNLKKIDDECKEGDTVLVVGKVLGSGGMDKKLRVCALSFSESAREKLKEKKCEIVTILEEIRKNPKMEGVRVLK